eukprot:TRINITY_DN78107_c0_g1_i1.p2 TRINITY_DN78107_c0_g1~~TRINITY_DN78107_c0_g1_i1.p2  ORF type:complete len:272 (+),score=131.81 TRINITY_DN78107_c0_g1_i1:73-888(+)
MTRRSNRGQGPFPCCPEKQRLFPLFPHDTRSFANSVALCAVVVALVIAVLVECCPENCHEADQQVGCTQESHPLRPPEPCSCVGGECALKRNFCTGPNIFLGIMCGLAFIVVAFPYPFLFERPPLTDDDDYQAEDAYGHSDYDFSDRNAGPQDITRVNRRDLQRLASSNSIGDIDMIARKMDKDGSVRTMVGSTSIKFKPSASFKAVIMHRSSENLAALDTIDGDDNDDAKQQQLQQRQQGQQNRSSSSAVTHDAVILEDEYDDSDDDRRN